MESQLSQVIDEGTASQTEEPKERPSPIHTIRLGALRAAIWANRLPAGVIHNVTLSRSYRDGEVWRESSSFGVDDLLCLAKALDFAHTWILEHRRARSHAEKTQF